ncbi:uncharacterized protein DDB_G0290685-like isoform X2 [Megalops cyprinoides]|uniref:uncharacterized protein DDB_G0290685-like isoform X2 n=1 Tax=Megalops cyprinoides TaxID=118141 RepID=UPI001864F563|nr:uncharacterized protein DDB_G0290685-like isoform X2 [Megalops cyprinoides]
MENKRYMILTFSIFMDFTLGEVAPGIYGQVNGNITLKPNAKSRFDEIIWTHNNNLVVEFEKNKITEYGQFKERIILNHITGHLTITNLITRDSGEYRADLMSAGVFEPFIQTVEILDTLTKPKVTCHVNGTMVTLLCAGDLSPVTQYSWEGPEAQNQSGPELQLQRKESSDSVYTCVLSNPVSQSSEKFNIQSCFPAGDEEDDSVPVVAIVVCLLLLLLLLILGLLFMYRKKYWSVGRGKRGKEENPEAPPEDESAQLISQKHENQQSPVQGNVRDKVTMFNDMSKGLLSPNKPSHENERTPLKARDSMTKETVGLSQEESQAGEWRGAGSLIQDEGFQEIHLQKERERSPLKSPKHSAPSTLQGSVSATPHATPPETGKGGVSDDQSSQHSEVKAGERGDKEDPAQHAPADTEENETGRHPISGTMGETTGQLVDLMSPPPKPPRAHSDSEPSDQSAEKPFSQNPQDRQSQESSPGPLSHDPEHHSQGVASSARPRVADDNEKSLNRDGNEKYSHSFTSTPIRNTLGQEGGAAGAGDGEHEKSESFITVPSSPLNTDDSAETKEESTGHQSNQQENLQANRNDQLPQNGSPSCDSSSEDSKESTKLPNGERNKESESDKPGEQSRNQTLSTTKETESQRNTTAETPDTKGDTGEDNENKSPEEGDDPERTPAPGSKTTENNSVGEEEENQNEAQPLQSPSADGYVRNKVTMFNDMFKESQIIPNKPSHEVGRSPLKAQDSMTVESEEVSQKERQAGPLTQDGGISSPGTDAGQDGVSAPQHNEAGGDRQMDPTPDTNKQHTGGKMATQQETPAGNADAAYEHPKENMTTPPEVPKEKASQGDTTGNRDASQGDTTRNRDTSQGDTKGNRDASQGDTTGNRDASQGDTTRNRDTSQGDTKGNRDASQGDTTGNRDASQGDTNGNRDASQGDTTGNRDA